MSFLLGFFVSVYRDGFECRRTIAAVDPWRMSFSRTSCTCSFSCSANILSLPKGFISLRMQWRGTSSPPSLATQRRNPSVLRSRQRSPRGLLRTQKGQTPTARPILLVIVLKAPDFEEELIQSMAAWNSLDARCRSSEAIKTLLGSRVEKPIVLFKFLQPEYYKLPPNLGSTDIMSLNNSLKNMVGDYSVGVFEQDRVKTVCLV
jgi:hypothetical protein